MKRGLIVLLIFLLTITSVSALEVTYDVVQGEALPGNSVAYTLHLNNNEASTLDIKLRATDLNWLLDQDGDEFSIGPGQSKSYELTFRPLSREDIAPGNYGINLVVNTQTTRLEKVLPAKVLAYTEVLTAAFERTPQIDPRRPAILRLNVINEHKVLLNNLNVELTSPHFQFTRSVNLAKEETELLEFPVRLDPETVRGEYTANVKVTMSGKTFLDAALPYTVEEYEDVKEVIAPQQGFLIGGEIITQSNEGNSPVEKTVSREFSWFRYRFASFEPEPSRVSKLDSGYLVEWDVSLQPLESQTIAYAVNYRLFTLLILIVIAALILWYVFRKRNAIVIDKRVLTMHTETGNVGIMKVIINARNRGTGSLSNVRIVDKVPSSIKAPTQYGGLRPNHIKAMPEGTAMVWDLPQVRAGEEKIISYRLEGKIQVLGKITLPAAVAKYTLFGRMVTARSSTASLRKKWI